MADLVGSVRAAFAVWQPKFCLNLTPTGNLLSLKRFLMHVWESGTFFAGGARRSRG